MVVLFVLIMSKFELTSKSQNRLFVEVIQSQRKNILNTLKTFISSPDLDLSYIVRISVYGRTRRSLGHRFTKYRVFQWREIVKYGCRMGTVEKELDDTSKKSRVRIKVRSSIIS